MKCELHIISGARNGFRDVFEKSYIGLGRHPLSDIRFDAEQDLDASTRHAAIVKTGETWVLRDLGSTNGTFLNGEKVEADRPLKDGDIMKFGVHGPEVSFHLIREDEGGEVVMPAVQAPKPAPSKTRQEAPVPQAAARQATPDERTTPMEAKPKAPPSKTAVLRAEIGAQKTQFRALAVAAAIIVLGALGVVYWQGVRNQTDLSIRDTTITRLSTQLAALQAAQAATDSQKTRLEAQLRAARDPAQQQELRDRIASATQRINAIQAAQGVDYDGIQRMNMAAVAVIYVRYPDSSMFEGTAFSINSQGVMLTNKHNVVSPAGQPARDIAIRFSGSTDVLPARVVRTAPDADLAVLQLESAGPFPTVRGLDSGVVAPGSPIALIGFPGGSNNADRPRSKLVTGSVTAASDSSLELDAFSGTGASGSPIFNRDGLVVGILYGGRGGASSSDIVGLPIRRAMGLLGN